MTTQVRSAETALSGNRPVPDGPLDHGHLSGQTSHGNEKLAFRLPPDLTRRLALLTEQEGVPLAAVYLGAYAILLSRYGNTLEVNVGTSFIAHHGSRRVDRLKNMGSVSVIGIDCSPETPVRQFLHQVAHFVAAGEKKISPDRALEIAAAGSSGFVWENTKRIDRAIPARPMRVAEYGNEDILLWIQSSGDAMDAALLYRSDLFEPDRAERIPAHLFRLLEQMASVPEASVAELDMMPVDERALVLGLYAGSSSDYPQACLHQLFAEQAVLHPDAEAVVYAAERLTYGQLDRRSNQVAQFLEGEGIRPEDRVGIFMNRSADMVIAMLGVLKSGGAYVPIDVDYPAEQLKFIADDSALRLVLTHGSASTIFPSGTPSVYVDGKDSPIGKCGFAPVINRSTPESIAVVTYTSGSTGLPKGACIPHRAAVRTVRNTNYVQVAPTDRIAQSGSPAFDAAIMEIWLALANGATVVGVRRESLLSPGELASVLRAEQINILVLNTSYVHQIARDAPEALKGVRKVLFGGEAAEPGPLRALLQQVGPGVLVNGYGPAEGCVITTYHEITDIPENAVTVPIGRPVSNAQIYLLDTLGRPVPIGVPGEIYIGGEGVARGYLNRPDLTTERFHPDVFSGKPDRPLYRTGDFARMRGNGELEFVGRTDEQVKLRGHRIELAEVRHAIASHSEVKQLFLMIREDVPGDKRLVAYVTLHNPATGADSLRQDAMSKLPMHMVPSVFVVVESIPLNVNGKVDRKRLPLPSERPELAAGYQSAEGDMECRLTQIWQQLLRVENIGVNDNFFDLGGHSLLAARLIARIEKLTGTNIPMATLFEAPTIAQLANRLGRNTCESAWSPLVELSMPERGSALAPFFCVHSLGANLVSFRGVATLMRGDRAIYGLQPHGLDARDQPLESIELIAAAYVEEIRKKQPRGPYYIGGVCLGGVIAYEMAQQLTSAGETVALTALIDAYMPGEMRYLHDRAPLTQYLDRHLGEMWLLPVVSRLKYVARWLANGGVLLRRALGFRDHSSLARATRKVAVAHRRALYAYKPKSYAGKVVQLMCSDAGHRAYEDRRLAWSSLTSAGFELRIVPGDHLSMVEAPHAQTLAKELQCCLDRNV